jgi:hypothetical protein
VSYFNENRRKEESVMKKKLLRLLVPGIVIIGMWANVITAMAAEFTVSAETANIRVEASTDSATVGSTSRGRVLPVSAEASDSQGFTWYRVEVEAGTYGYIRADLGTLSGTIGDGSGENSGGETDPAPTQRREATINQRSVNVRSGASTSHTAVTSLANGTEVIIVGEATDSAGRTWYQINTTVDDQPINGFVRSDMLTLGNYLDEPIIEQPPEDIPPDVPVNDTEEKPQDEDYAFYIRYEQNEIGGYDYFLVDRRHGTQWIVEEFLELSRVAEANELLYQAQASRQRTTIIVLGVLTGILVLAVAVLLFKIRDIGDDLVDDAYLRGPAQPRGGTRPASGDANRRPSGTAINRSASGKSGTRPNDGSRGPKNTHPGGRPPSGSPALRQGGTRPQSGIEQTKQGSRPDNPNRPLKPESSGQTMGTEQKNAEQRPKTNQDNKGLDNQVNETTVNPDPAQNVADNLRAESERANSRANSNRKSQNFLSDSDDDEFDYEFL